MPKFNIDPRYGYEPNAREFGGPYSCIDDRTYDGAGSNMIGWGQSPEEALEDLERLFEEQADYQQAQHEAECERRGIQGFGGDPDYAMNDYELRREAGEK